MTAVETIVNALLQVGERVVEIARDGTIRQVWDQGSAHILHEVAWRAGMNIVDSQDDLLRQCAPKITESFENGQKAYLECSVEANGQSITYGVRVLPLHPDRDVLFVVIEQMQLADWIQQPDKAKDTEELLDKQRIFYERILNNISSDIVALDDQYRFLYVNPTAVQDEETRKWLIGKTDAEFFAHRGKPAILADRRRNMYEAARNDREVIEWVEKSNSVLGTMKYVQRRIYPVFDDKGNLDIIIGNSMNITELITAQEELKTSRDTFESAFHDSGIGMAMLSPEGGWVDVNKVLCSITGYSKNELMQLSLKELTYPEDLEMDRKMVRMMLRRELPNQTLERRYISKQGKEVLVLLTLSLVWSQDDVPKFFIAQVVDITNKKELEKEIARKNAELEDAKANLINKVSQLEELSYIIAHNLRGPAANIKLLTEALLATKDSGGGGLSGAFTTEEGLGFIQDASTSLMNSLASLMKIAEIKLNKEIPLNECVVGEIVNDVTTQLQSSIREKQAHIHLVAEVPVINYPKAYLESIIYNFVSNALKYQRPGVPPEIRITTQRAGDRIQLIVKDNGSGIDLERYGSRMFKLNQVFHAGHDSKGFGLYLTKTQVESLGGSITVNSKLNEGTEFVVTL